MTNDDPKSVRFICTYLLNDCAMLQQLQQAHRKIPQLNMKIPIPYSLFPIPYSLFPIF